MRLYTLWRERERGSWFDVFFVDMDLCVVGWWRIRLEDKEESGRGEGEWAR